MPPPQSSFELKTSKKLQKAIHDTLASSSALIAVESGQLCGILTGSASNQTSFALNLSAAQIATYLEKLWAQCQVPYSTMEWSERPSSTKNFYYAYLKVY